jgi:hypothetical protein
MDFSDEANWEAVYDQLTIGSIIDALTYYPIPPIVLPNSLTYPFLRVTANNQNAKAWWQLGAWIEFCVDEPNPQVEVHRAFARVNRAVIIPKPSFLTSYRIRAVIPYYFDEISLQIDGFTGSL